MTGLTSSNSRKSDVSKSKIVYKKSKKGKKVKKEKNHYLMPSTKTSQVEPKAVMKIASSINLLGKTSESNNSMIS